MGNWRDQILKAFVPDASRLTLVADPDALLLEERIQGRLRERGFEVVPFEDHVSFRYAYEANFRSSWDKDGALNLVVALHAQRDGLGTLPFDLLGAGRQLSFHLGDIFPNLSYPVIAGLDRSDLDLLYAAQEQHDPDRMRACAEGTMARGPLSLSPPRVLPSLGASQGRRKLCKKHHFRF